MWKLMLHFDDKTTEFLTKLIGAIKDKFANVVIPQATPPHITILYCESQYCFNDTYVKPDLHKYFPALQHSLTDINLEYRGVGHLREGPLYGRFAVRLEFYSEELQSLHEGLRENKLLDEYYIEKKIDKSPKQWLQCILCSTNNPIECLEIEEFVRSCLWKYAGYIEFSHFSMYDGAADNPIPNDYVFGKP